jgi:Flp pilus assembly protein TadD
VAGRIAFLMIAVTSKPLLLFLFVASVAPCQDDHLRIAADLDKQGKCAEAETHYRQALSKGPASPALLNNIGNHYLICGDAEQARSYFEQLLKTQPAHPNANLQLARIAAGRKQGGKALQYLEQVKDTSPAVRLLRAEALHFTGQSGEAQRLLDAVAQEGRNDARVLFAIGLTFARIGAYDRAESAFNDVLATRPDDFDVLVNLGRAAARAQHYDRARRALEAAVKLRPADADALLELGLAYAALEEYSRSVYVLAQARQRDPRRPDILLPLARAAEDAGYYGDSALAYDEYLRLRPDDDTARRDRGRVCGHTGLRLEEGLKELRWYVEKYPKDPMGHFSLAQFTWKTDPDTALAQLAAALRLDPSFVPAHYGRAWLLHRLGRTGESLSHLQAVVRLQPENVRALDQLGVTYLTLEQGAQAARVLRRALALAPQDPDVLMHLGRALISLDRAEEAQPYLQQFRKLRPRTPRGPRRGTK